jgi:L-ascorbate metabolism protein UlaG (beta-lactamase superfamily)
VWQAVIQKARRQRFLRRTLVASCVVLFAPIGLGCWAFAGPRYRGEASEHFDGKRFVTPNAPERSGFGGLLKWQTHREHGAWSDYREVPPGPPPPREVRDGRLRVTFINHATTLIQMDGINVLTDPIWSERCSPVSWAGPKRVRPPGIRFEDLPRIDAVVISHNHYDHLDLETLKRLEAAHHPRFFVGLGNAPLLTNEGLSNVSEVDWWRSFELRDGVRITSVPSQHFSNRGICDQDATLWTSYAVEGPSGWAFFAGDTGYGPQYAEIRRRLGPPRLAVLPIGAYKPEWFMGPIHMSPRQALLAHQDLEAGTSVAMHYGTFDLADDGETEPPEELRRAIAESKVPVKPFWTLEFGEGRDVP